MKEKLFLAGVLALGGCAAPMPKPAPVTTPEISPTSIFTGNVVSTVDCQKGPYLKKDEPVLLKAGERLIFSAKTRQGKEIGIEIGNVNYYEVGPKNTSTNLIGAVPYFFDAVAEGVDYGLSLDKDSSGVMTVDSSVDCDTSVLWVDQTPTS